MPLKAAGELIVLCAAWFAAGYAARWVREKINRGIEEDFGTGNRSNVQQFNRSTQWDNSRSKFKVQGLTSGRKGPHAERI